MGELDYISFSRCNIFEILQLWFYLLCFWIWVQSLARTAGDPSTFLICTNNLKNLPTFGNLSRIIQTKPTVLPDLFRVIVTYVSCSLGLRSPPTLRHTCWPQNKGNKEIILDIIETYLSRGGIGGWSKRLPSSARLSLGGRKDGQFDFSAVT